MNKAYQKNIACLESLWDADVENKLTVIPLLELIASINSVRFTHLTCNTLKEFEFNLRSLPHRRNYRILYLAFHGNPGEIQLGDGTCVTIENLASMMARRFAGWIVHFGACGTLEVANASLSEFYRQTEVAMMIGYRNDIDWTESAAMDLILLDLLQRYRSLGAMRRYVKNTYPDMVKKTGLTIYNET